MVTATNNSANAVHEPQAKSKVGGGDMESRGRHDELYLVVTNAEQQYSIWPKWKPLPRGWTAVGVEGTEEQCLDHIEKVWTDLRPLSLRRQMHSAS